MKGLFVFLAVVAVASAGIPARAEKGIIDDILAAKECIEGVIASVQGDVALVIAAVKNLQNVIDGGVAEMKKCTSAGGAMEIAQCIMDVASGLESQIQEAILGVQQSISGLLGVPDLVAACFKPNKSAAIPVRAEKGIIDDILAVKECLEGVIASVQGDIGLVIAAVQNLQNVIEGGVAELKKCTSAGGAMEIAQCIMDVASGLESQIQEAILGVQQSISGLLGLPDLVVACFKPINKSAVIPVRAEKGIIDDILAVKECLEGVIASVQGDVALVIAAVQNLQNVIEGGVAEMKKCTSAGGAMEIAQCILDVASGLESQIQEAILGVQQSISGMLGLPDQVVACFKPMGK